MRQVDPAQGGRRLSPPGGGGHAPQGAHDLGAWSGPGDGVPGVRPAPPLEDRQAEHHLRADERRAVLHGRRGRRHRAAVHPQGEARPVRGHLPPHALRRHEAARRHRPRHGDGAGHPADGRAVRGPRRPHPAPDAGRAPAALGGHPFHGALRHPFHRGGVHRRQPHPRDVPASRAGEGGAQRPSPRPREHRRRSVLVAAAAHPRHAVRGPHPRGGGGAACLSVCRTPVRVAQRFAGW